MILLDTHLVLWAALDAGRLPRKVMQLIEDRSSPVAYSLVTLWEVTLKTSLGRPDFNVDAVALRAWLADEGFAELPITAEHVLQLATLPWHHRDPFDRMLVAQAQVEQLTLWTADKALKAYGRSIKVA